jgi:hypothetical protein
MQQAAGIVTDLGGVLENGQFVEVDADAGAIYAI